LDGHDGQLRVRCFSQDGEDHRDYDLSGLGMAANLRDALVTAFARRTAPGAGLTSLRSTDHAYRALVAFDCYLATLTWPPREASQLASEHFDGFYDSRKHVGYAAGELSDLKGVLAKVEGISDALAGRLARPLPKRPAPVSKQSYSRAELKRIADAARADLRAAAQRIRDNREVLRRHRAGELEAGGDRRLATHTNPGHIGIYVGSGRFINAPFTGAAVRFDSMAPGTYRYQSFIAGGRVVTG
jgi:hypothetical protein